MPTLDPAPSTPSLSGSPNAAGSLAALRPARTLAVPRAGSTNSRAQDASKRPRLLRRASPDAWDSAWPVVLHDTWTSAQLLHGLA